MRVSGNVPQFTFDHWSSFVNGFYWVSTGILPFSSGFVPLLAQMQEWMGIFQAKSWDYCSPGRRNRTVQ
jgi:hypothetical protein